MAEKKFVLSSKNKIIPKTTERKKVSEYSKLEIGPKSLDDATLKLSTLADISKLADKTKILQAIQKNDVTTMRDISDYFYKTSGIYSRILRYLAFMYRYDWYITPYVNSKSVKSETVLDGFYKSLNLMDGLNVKRMLGEIALKVLRFGCYYGYKTKTNGIDTLQELPVEYCRSRFRSGNKDVVEFNVKFFDDKFRNTDEKMKMLDIFPVEILKGYIEYKKGNLPAETPGDSAGWYLLDPANTVRFTANGEDYPSFISVTPLIVDLDEAQALDRKRMMQKLLKIIVQEIPMDKNGELLLDDDEVIALHRNAVGMLAGSMGVNVLTTFANISVEDMTDSNSAAQTDDLERVERQLFNEAGVSQMQFNTDGNLALEKSLQNDEATMYNLLLQFEDYLNELLEPFNKKPKKVNYKLQILTTTIYNYKELSKLYKEQTQLGYSKMLPQIALGQSQSSVLANAFFENDVLDLVNLFIPPLMSSSMSGDAVMNASNTDSKVGRQELADEDKTEKTIQNKESAN